MHHSNSPPVLFLSTSLQDARHQTLDDLRKLVEPPTSFQVAQAVLCHLSRGQEEEKVEGEDDKFKCELCVAESTMVEYGCKLFSGYHSSAR